MVDISDYIDDAIPDINIDFPDFGEELTQLGDSIDSAFNELAEEAREGLESIGEGISDAAKDVAEGTLNVIENAGVAILKAGARTKEYFVDEVGDRRVQFVKQLTILIIVLITTVFIYNSLMFRDR